MVEITPPEMAQTLGVSGLTFRNWLRSEKAAGHPLLAGHERRARYRFTEEQAVQLIAEYRASGGRARAPGQPYTGAATRPMSMRPTARRTDNLRDMGEAPRRRPASAPTDDPFDGLALSADPGHRVVEHWMGERVITLADLLGPGLRGVVVGINPSPVSVAAGHYYQGPVGQRFLSRLVAAGVLELCGDGFEDDQAYAHGIGFTDAVKRPTSRAHALRPRELAHGRDLLVARLADVRAPRVIFTFKRAAVGLLGRFDGHGVVPGLTLGHAQVFVMPGPMERTDRVQRALRDLADWWTD